MSESVQELFLEEGIDIQDMEGKKLWYVGRQGGAVLEEGRDRDVRILSSLRLGVPVAVYLRGIWNWY